MSDTPHTKQFHALKLRNRNLLKAYTVGKLGCSMAPKNSDILQTMATIFFETFCNFLSNMLLRFFLQGSCNVMKKIPYSALCPKTTKSGLVPAFLLSSFLSILCRRRPQGRHPRSRHSLLGRHPLLGRHLPPGQTPPSWVDTPLDRHPLLRRHPPLPEMAIEAGATHPTGMHSCLIIVSHFVPRGTDKKFYCLCCDIGQN